MVSYQRMIHKKINQHGPLYREVLRNALIIGWRERRLWGFAILAGLLHTGGIIDAIVRALKIISEQTPSVFSSNWLVQMPTTLFGMTTLTIKVAVAALVLMTVFVASVISQSALAIGVAPRRALHQRSTLLQLLFDAGRFFWPVATLNIISLGLLWCSKFLLLLPLAFSLRAPTFLSVFIYTIAYALFLSASIFFVALHFFALQAIVIDKKTLMDAIVRGYEHFKRAWLIVIETALILLLIGTAIFALTILVFSVAIIPFFLLLAVAAVLEYQTVVGIGIILGVLLFFALAFLAGSYAITMQYAAWGDLYLRVDEGNARAKIHRLLNWLIA